ncbi:MAG TPA: hypothetical protein VFF17_00715 [Thermoanaerobaculia bacterium]|nr:hypothetical protein [Thermoanaerobaculia bacterium]
MPDLPPPRTLRVLGPPEPAPARRRGPGVAVLAIAAYALAFFAALWLLRAHSPIFRRPAPAAGVSEIPAAPTAPPVEASRASLLAGEGLAPLARAEFLGRLASDCCDCGCEMTLQECLVSDQTCTRSPEIANELRRASAP